jgi:trigger factor
MTDEPKSEGTEPAATATEATEQPITEPVEEAAAEGQEAEAPKKLRQTVDIKDIGPCKKHIKVTVERDDIDELLNLKYSELVTDAQVSGFRPGKAPRKIIQRRFKKDVEEQVRGELLLASLEQVAEDHDIAPLTAPDIDPTKIEIPENGPLVYEFEVEVRPQFDLPNYKGLKLRRPVQTFTEADIDREERRLLAPFGQVVPKEGASPAVEAGDYVVADIMTQSGGQALNAAKEAVLRVDEQLVFKDGVAEKFAQQLKGARAGDKREVEITLSDVVANPAMRGQKVKAIFEVKEVKTIRLPEITHELMHQFGVHSREQLRELIQVLLDRRLQYQQRQAAREQVLAEIADAQNWELPRELLIRQSRKALSRKVMEMRSAGMPEDEIMARQRLLQQDVVESTTRSLKEHFVLQKIAEVEKIDISEDDIDNEIERLAAQNNESPRRLRARMEKEDLLDVLATEIIENKALEVVLQSAEYEDVPVGATPEHSMGTSEAQAIPGEMTDPTEPPKEEEPKPEAE